MMDKAMKQAKTIVQIDASTENVIAEHASAKEAASAVGKPNGTANILLCCAANHLVDGNSRKAYGYHWRFGK